MGLQGKCRLVHLMPEVQDLCEGTEEEGAEGLGVMPPAVLYLPCCHR